MKTSIVPYKWETKFVIYDDNDNLLYESEPQLYSEAVKLEQSFNKSKEIFSQIFAKLYNQPIMPLGEMWCQGEIKKGNQ